MERYEYDTIFSLILLHFPPLFIYLNSIKVFQNHYQWIRGIRRFMTESLCAI